MADIDEISGVHGLPLLTRQACTRKYPGVHAQAQACTGIGAGAGGLTATHQEIQAWSVFT